MTYGNTINLDESTHIVPVFDPVLRTLSVHLWKDGEPIGRHDLVENFTHPDDILGKINAFLEQSGARALTEHEVNMLASELIMVTVGPEAALLMMILRYPESFVI